MQADSNALPNNLWAETWATANYLRNRSPCSANPGNKTPNESFYGSKPVITDLYPYGATVYVHVPDVLRKKLDAKARKCQFLGYEPGAKAYRCWNPVSRKVVVSRDVIFPKLRTTQPADENQNKDDSTTNGTHIEGEKAKDTSDVPNLSTNLPAAPPNALPTDPPGSAPQSKVRKPRAPPPEPTRRSERKAGMRPLTEDEIKAGVDPRADEEASNDMPMSTEAELAHWVHCFVAFGDEPASFRDATTGETAEDWRASMKEEWDRLNNLGTFKLVNLPPGRKAIGCRWVYKIKKNEKGETTRLKSRLVAQGFSQVPGIDYQDTFAPVVRSASLKTALAIFISLGWIAWTMDVVSAFLNGDLTEEIFMKQPPGFTVNGQEDRVLQILKSLYGLKQASRIWNKKFTAVLKDLGFTQLISDYCVFIRYDECGKSVILVHVDDLTLLCNILRELERLKRELSSRMDMTDTGPAKWLLGIELIRNPEERTITLSQRTYIDSILAEFNLEDAKVNTHRTPLPFGCELTKEDSPMTEEDREEMRKVPYAIAVGKLAYLTHTRPDIASSVCAVSQFMSNPGRAHWNAVKHILRYVKGTRDLALTVGGIDGDPVLMGATDATWMSDPDDRKSVGGYVFKLGVGAISYSSRKQASHAMSSTESEYIAASSAVQEALWLRNLLAELGFPQTSPTVFEADNQGAIANSKDPRQHRKMRHIELKYHMVRANVENGTVEFIYVPSELNTADILTKPLRSPDHERHVHGLGLHPIRGGVLR